MVAESNLEHLVRQVDDSCSLIIKLPPSIQEEEQQFPTPYLILIDWGHDERDYTAGHPDDAKRLSPEEWNNMMTQYPDIGRACMDKIWCTIGSPSSCWWLYRI
ncbi:hypothetical protein [Peribacillus butanolivorans]|uniref:hypothetical protein n=1 Tax=Peribacillus butanolivorans TaxID=421767 RepID=UPI001CC09715|nr:hypothetical protein [Peribacillus butanolivorans]